MPALLWFRRDLRLGDHPALTAAADNEEVLACFVLDPRLESSSGRRRLQFLGDSLRQLRDDLDGRLLITRGRPEDQVIAGAAARGVAVEGLGDYALRDHARGPALVIGYATPPDHAYTTTLAQLTDAIKDQ